ncbi:MAG: biopolymer transporter ExbD [Candidatus Hydrogenedentes bacterium]|nr:biopolymer transporter ExbD [Candidatus Hydrogenedentota bacterium]
MRGAFNQRRERRKPYINIVNLVDVLFLLLIFFMISSTFRQHLGIDIMLPEAATSTNLDVKPHEIVVSQAGELFFGDQKVDEAGLHAAIAELLKTDPKADIVLRADEGANFGRVVKAIDIAREVGGSRLIIPTRFKESGTPQS